MKAPRWRLFPKYATLIIALVAGVLIVSGAISIYFSYRETRAQLVSLQHEKAQGAATRIEQYVLEIEHQMSWTALPRVDTAGDVMEQRRIEYLKLLRQAPAITEVAWIDAAGRQQLRVSRLEMDAVAPGDDLSHDARFTEPRVGKTHYGAVYFRKGTEPYMTISRQAGSSSADGVTAAEVNLKFVWDVVSRIKIGQAGLAYVVDGGGTLIAHPDISLVLKKSDLSALPQVAARALEEGADQPVARDLKGAEVLSAHVPIPTLGWTVFVESPRAEAYAPLYATILRTGLLLLGGLLVATAASFLLARALVRPIRALQDGAAKLGAGELEHRIDVRTGDELEGLAAQFNRMGADLKESYAGLERKVEARTAELSEALDYQTAISDVLRVISESPTDVAPVFETILDSATRLFGSPVSGVYRYDGKLVHLVATRNWTTEALEMAHESYPMRADQALLAGRVIAAGKALSIEDALTDSSYSKAFATAGGWRRIVGAPMLKGQAPVGAILVGWTDPGPTPKRQSDLLKTFADQAVIAIENVRLFNETTEALERQTATSEILRVISESPTDVQPVLQAVADRSGLLCRAEGSRVWLPDGEHLRAMTGYQHEVVPEAGRGELLPMRGTSVVGRAFVERRTVHIEDIATLVEAEYPDSQSLHRRHAGRTILAVPMLREGISVGAISMVRKQVRPFSKVEIDLVKTFADQAVIAIENVRLFNETKEALEQQTASAEILQVISSSVANVKPVFDAILDSCERLFRSGNVAIHLIGDDGMLRATAYRVPNPEAFERSFPVPVDEATATGQAITQRRVLHFPDVEYGPEVPASLRRAAMAAGTKSLVLAPLIWEDRGIGSLVVGRSVRGAFSDKEIALVRTFADQAVIAIQNARLFDEIQSKSLELEAANRHKSEFLANMSHELRTPLNAIIGFSEVLTEQMFGDVNAKQLEYLQDIHSSGQHLLTLINDVLDLSKIEAGRMELDLSCFDLGLLLDNSLTLVRERARRQGLSVALEVGDGLDEWVADARKVKQVVVNLLSNAVKFTPAGGRVDLRARRSDNGAGAVAHISVADTGVGIAAEDQTLVFEEFRQARGDNLRKAEGTGLGLALARRLVELHGGSIGLDSRPGAGSAFTVTLPLLTLETIA